MSSPDLTTAVDLLSSRFDLYFSYPTGADFATLYAYGLTLPLSAFLVAWSVGKLLSMLRGSL